MSVTCISHRSMSYDDDQASPEHVEALTCSTRGGSCYAQEPWRTLDRVLPTDISPVRNTDSGYQQQLLMEILL